MSARDDLLPGFATRVVATGEADIHVRFGGRGPPLLLLHGYPETHAAWHRVAPVLAVNFTVVAPDLRGYGRSSCPPSDGQHQAYSKRTMALDAARLMAQLGFDRFAVMGHDRGGRVAYRLALDWPDRVERLVLLDIMSTWDQWQPEHQSTRHRLIHWGFLAQPSPIPETLIGAKPVAWLEARLRRGTRTLSLSEFDPRAMADYVASLADADRIHATCEDYRAGAGCDLADDEADRRAGRRIECPTLLMWGSHGSIADLADPVALWRPWCRHIEGCQIESGHYIPEENPEALLAAAMPFLGVTGG